MTTEEFDRRFGIIGEQLERTRENFLAIHANLVTIGQNFETQQKEIDTLLEATKNLLVERER